MESLHVVYKRVDEVMCALLHIDKLEVEASALIG